MEHNKKKHPGRYTLAFDLSDPQHQKVCAVLDQAGRHKAKLIANALVHYLTCDDAPKTDFLLEMEKLAPALHAAETPARPQAIRKRSTETISSIDPVDLGDQDASDIRVLLQQFRSD